MLLRPSNVIASEAPPAVARLVRGNKIQALGSAKLRLARKFPLKMVPLRHALPAGGGSDCRRRQAPTSECEETLLQVAGALTHC